MRGRFATVAVALCAAAGLAACGSDDGSGGGGDMELTVVLGSVAGDVPNRIGVQKGFFEDEGVKVTLSENAAANTPNLVVSGKGDLASYTASSPASLSQKGRDVSIVYGMTGGGQGGNVFVGEDGVDSIEDLGDEDGCRIGSQPPPTSAYGNAARYNEDLDLGCELVPLADPTAQVGALSSGSVDAVVGSYSNFTEAEAEGKVRAIVDTREEADREKYIGAANGEVVMFGLADDLDDKREAVQAYLRGLDKARAYLEDTPTKKLAAELGDMEAYKPLSPKAIAASIESFRPYVNVGTDEGRIDEKQWQLTLDRMKFWDVPGYDAGSDRVAYDSVVDMSYFDEAIKR